MRSVSFFFSSAAGWGLDSRGVISASGSSSRATARMAGIRASGSSAVRRSCSVAKVMVASSTPGMLLIFRSILAAQLAQSMPVIL